MSRNSRNVQESTHLLRRRDDDGDDDDDDEGTDNSSDILHAHAVLILNRSPNRVNDAYGTHSSNGIASGVPNEVDGMYDSNTDNDPNVTQYVVGRFMDAQKSLERKGVSLLHNPENPYIAKLRTFFGNRLVRFILLLSSIALMTIGWIGLYFKEEYIHTNETYDTIDDGISNKPNIIFILADDLGWNSIGYRDFDMNFTTPKLTSLAKAGIILDNYYTAEVCTPSRASLLTGRYPLTVAMQYSVITPTSAFGLRLDETLISSVLQDNGYKTHMIGKWHLGHFSPKCLPTARGFDSYLGYLSGETYYWSKLNPDHQMFTDMLSSDDTCWAPYQGIDLHTYSTFLYRDKAIEIIQEHDASDALFMYLSFQAVHDPFMDKNHFANGVPKEYLSEGIYDLIHSNVVGHKRREYAMALSILDDAVADIYTAIEAKGIMNNTYVIFSSDNGGCYLAGGKNGPLRGTKGSLFEGGSKVDAFIYSPLLSDEVKGSVYTNLMHVSDWFPTILDFANITYIPEAGFELDGVSHALSFNVLNSSTAVPRDYMLYNYIYNIKDLVFDMWVNGSFAVRNDQYKLMHTWDSSVYGKWFDYTDLIESDDSLEAGTCSQTLAATGVFTYYLFDLINDPYEITNLYDDDSLSDVKEKLYAMLDVYAENSQEIVEEEHYKNRHTYVSWKNHADYIVPWAREEELDGDFPRDCFGLPSSSPTSTPTIFTPSKRPSKRPTNAPTKVGDTIEPTSASPVSHTPSRRPTKKPSMQPTSKPIPMKATLAPSSRLTLPPTAAATPAGSGKATPAGTFPTGN